MVSLVFSQEEEREDDEAEEGYAADHAACYGARVVRV